jgi:glucose/arabinose dehydrogenase
MRQYLSIHLIFICFFVFACDDEAVEDPGGGENNGAVNNGANNGVNNGAVNNGANNGVNNGVNNGANNGGPGPLSLRFVPVALPAEHREITEFKFIPGREGELIFFEKNGLILHMRLEGDRLVELGRFRLTLPHTDLDCGLLSLAFAPDFAESQHAYIGMCVSGQESAITRVTLDTSDYAAIPGTLKTVLTVGDARATRPWHNIGSMGFDQTGALWALFGEKTIRDNAQDLENALGGMIRILPDADGEGYEPAPDNPFYDAEDGRSPLLYAWGLRSPWKGAYDRQGRWWVGDVGDNAFEEVNLIDAAGQNFGWPLAEGPCESGCAGLRDPLASWDRGDAHPYVRQDPEVEPAVARTAWVGVVYEGGGGDPYGGRLQDTLLYGDMCLGYVRGLKADAAGAVVSDQHLGHMANLSGWDVGPGGYLYAVTFGACETKFGPQPSGFFRVEPEEN